MRDWVYGFFMAWGMFLAIPCPKKLWSETARRKMLVCLPLVGLLVGGIWAGAWLLLRGAPGPVRAAVCAAVPWLVTGFMHLDGYMDVCDAVLSRRDLPTRRRILKDSHCGAFAGLAVLGLRPMDTSQYAAMGASRGGYLAALAVLLVLAAGLPLWLWGSFAPLAAAAGYGLAVWYGYRNLDGMSGDISGFALTLGELCGCAAAILWR